MEPAATLPTRRSSWRILLPTVFVLIVAAAWCAFWFYAAKEAGTRLDALIAQEATKGREFSCGERQIGGFPFRFELRCRDAKVVISRKDLSLTLSARHLTAVAQIYRPMHIIAEADGPLLVTRAADPRGVEADWQGADASLILASDGLQRGSLVIKGLGLSEVEGMDRRPLISGADLEAHARPAASGPPGSYDMVALLAKARVPPLDGVLGGAVPLRAEIQAIVGGLTDLPEGSLSEQLKAWQAAGGMLKIALARLDRGPSSVTAAGDVGLDAEGRPSGRLTLALAGINELAASLKEAGAVAPQLANLLGVGLALLGKPTNIGGRPAIEVPLTLANGQATIGAYPAGALPRVF
jgi:hypothetical protein